MRVAKLWLVFLIAGTVFGQQPTQRPKKVLTPEQVASQQKMKIHDAEFQRLRGVATKAYQEEMVREKSGDCPHATTTFDINNCLSREMGVTESNYKTYAAALRGILALPSPDETPNETGPSGHFATSFENAAAFDKAESAWHSYATAECDAVDTFSRGGTIVNAMFGSCRQRVTRSRMHELDAAYEMMLHH